MAFDGEGQLSGSNGCQLLVADVVGDATTLFVLGLRLSAGPYCPSELVDDRVFEFFNTDSPIRWLQEDDVLVLLDAGGEELRYVAG